MKNIPELEPLSLSQWDIPKSGVPRDPELPPPALALLDWCKLVTPIDDNAVNPSSGVGIDCCWLSVAEDVPLWDAVVAFDDDKLILEDETEEMLWWLYKLLWLFVEL